VGGQDGIILLKTFEALQDVIFTNGSFVRFFRPDGSRVRNGFFVFEEGYTGGAQIAKMDLNGRGGRELLVVEGNKLSVWRDDGQLYTKTYPYGASYKGELRVAVGDLDADNKKEILIAPSEGHLQPIKIYSYDGTQLRDDWYPFGRNYDGGYNLDIGKFDKTNKSGILIGTGVGHTPIAHIYDYHYNFVHAWWPVLHTFRGGVDVAAGDVDGDGVDEVIIGPGSGMDPYVRIFDPWGNLKYSQFTAYSSFTKPGLDVISVDVDFDGKDDIVGMSEGI
jgi:hypothetical protein